MFSFISSSKWLFGVLIALFGALLWPLAATSALAASEKLRIGYLGQERDLPPALSNLDDVPADLGLAGARLGIADNATTGRFLGQTFELVERMEALDGDVAQALDDLAALGLRFIVADLEGHALDRVLSRAEELNVVLFNAGAPDDRFRQGDCRLNLLHTLPSRAMLADALAQYLVRRQWGNWFLIEGPRAEDKLYAEAIRRAAKRFGAKIVGEKPWTGNFDARRSAPQEMPLFTRDAPEHDVLIVADEIGDFGDYLMYRTWEPSLVAGTQGMVPAAWGRAVEQWGAAQLQERFLEAAKRPMQPRDWASWMAVRTLGEAATRAKSTDPDALKALIYSSKLHYAGFKSRKLSFRPWNGQLRQTVPLLTPRSVVSLSPQEGFLHPETELDTLGFDAPETECPTPLWSTTE